MILRLMRPLFTADAVGILLVAAALGVLPSGIAASVPDIIDTQRLFLICLAAAAVGLGWSKTQRNGIQASAGIAALGLLFIWILGARLTQPLLDLFAASFSTLKQILPAIRSDSPIDTSAIQEAWAVIAAASAVLWARLQSWLGSFNTSTAVNDTLIRSLFWVLIHWLVSAWAGWFTEKRKALVALLPALTLLTLVTSYSERQVEHLLAMFVILFLLMGLWHYRTHTIFWQKNRVDFSESLPVDIGLSVILITLTFTALAAMTPSLSWNDIVELLRRRENPAAEMLGVQRPPASPRPAATQQPSMPREHLLTGGYANSEKIVMTIRTGELPPMPNEMLPAPAPRYYWRSVVYDRYLLTGWGTSTVSRQNVPANTPLLPGLLNDYRLIKMDVHMLQPEGRLFWSATLFSVDMPFTAHWRLRPTSDLFADQMVLMQADMFSASLEAVSYHAEAYVPTPTIAQLRSASTEYPEAILDHYLALPRDIPARVRSLALDITKGVDNSYDKAQAIETYLRKNYPYDLEVPAPPPGQDVTDYFLFDLKKGYCDYYATAMVVLARFNGLPARFVSGYSPSSYDALRAQYIVRELNAHSWAEVYYPGVGWVEFEPTASLPMIDRQIEEPAIPPYPQDQESAARLLTRFRLERILIWLSPVIGLLVLAFLYYTVVQPWRLLRLEPAFAIHRIYQNFYRAGRPLIGAWERSGTSSEYLDTIIEIANELEAGSRKPFDLLKENAADLTRIYQRSLFVDYHATKQDAVHAWQRWSHLRRQLAAAKMAAYWMKFKKTKASSALRTTQ